MKKTKLAARSLCAAMLLSSCGTPCGQGDARPPRRGLTQRVHMKPVPMAETAR